jgi:methylenetetrahydrofolate reductase (NADPH)
MFFDNAKFYNYLTMAREIGIQIPIIPGLKIITNKSHITNLPKNFYIDIPVDLAEEVMKAKKEHVIDIGVEYAARQVEDLFNNGIKLIHFYIMQDSTPVKKLMEKLKL